MASFSISVPFTDPSEFEAAVDAAIAEAALEDGVDKRQVACAVCAGKALAASGAVGPGPLSASLSGAAGNHGTISLAVHSGGLPATEDGDPGETSAETADETGAVLAQIGDNPETSTRMASAQRYSRAGTETIYTAEDEGGVFTVTPVDGGPSETVTEEGWHSEFTPVATQESA